MARKRFSPEQIIGMLREAEVRLSQGEKIKGICRSLGIMKQIYFSWRKDYGGMTVSHARRHRCVKHLQENLGYRPPAPEEVSQPPDGAIEP